MKLIRIYTAISALPFRFAEQLASIIFKKVRRHFLEVCTAKTLVISLCL